MSIKVLIVEDELLTAEDLSDFLKERGFTVSGIAMNPEECFSLVKQMEPDIILMDIHLKSKLNGIEIAGIINRIKKIPIIFLTAYSDDRTIKKMLPLQPEAFITKPYNKKDVCVAIELIYQKYNLSNNNGNDKRTESIYLKDGPMYKRVDILSIYYIEAKGSYSLIVTEDKTYTLSYNLSYFLRQVKSPAFWKVHRSYVVNIHKVEGFSSNALKINKTTIPVSRLYQKEIQNIFKKI